MTQRTILVICPSDGCGGEYAVRLSPAPGVKLQGPAPGDEAAARLGDGRLPYNLPVDEAGSVNAELKDLTRQAGRDPDALRIAKIVYSTANAGVTEFNLASSGEIPLDEPGMRSKFAEFRETLVDPTAGW